MTGRCPNLGLLGNQNRVFSVATHRHRCYAGDQPERIAGQHQAQVCLAAAYHRCPRLSITAAGVPAAADLQATPVKKPRSGRQWTMTEFMVLGLGLAIFLAFSFTGYAVVYRLQVGPGMAAPALVAGVDTVTAVTATPTLVPTFTPTASPTPVAVALVAESPTPSPEPALPTPTSAIRPPADSPPTRLVIPKIGVDTRVLPVGVKTIQSRNGSKVIWADVPNAAGFHRTSAYPGLPGNTVINGHRDIQGSVFRNLDRVEIGDEILIYVGENAYAYDVTETLVVPETFASPEQRLNNLRLIGNMSEERLTLITCTPVGLATHRLLVIARPPDEIAPQMPEAGHSTGP